MRTPDIQRRRLRFLSILRNASSASTVCTCPRSSASRRRVISASHACAASASAGPSRLTSRSWASAARSSAGSSRARSRACLKDAELIGISEANLTAPPMSTRPARRQAGRRSQVRSTRSLERNDVTARAKAIEVIGPSLHHLPTPIEALCPVVGSPHLVAPLLGELQLDDVGRKAELVEQRRRHHAKPVPAHLFARVPHAPQRRGDRVVAQWPPRGKRRREHVTSAPGQWLNFAQDGDGLTRKRHQVCPPHLGAARGDSPFACTEIEL